MNKICSRCNGYGSLTQGTAFINAGELPPEDLVCPECNGKGYLLPRYFVEYIFEYDLTGRTYWLPLFILADTPEKAEAITEATLKALGEHYKNVKHTKPILETDFSQAYIQRKHNLHRNQKLAILNVDVWQFTDIDPNPDWSFDDHISFIAEELPLSQRTVAERVEARKFPVRVIREGQFSVEFKEFLLINVVKV